MKYLFKLAMKNIARSKRRTTLTFLMLAFGIGIYIFMYGMLEGFDKASFKNMIDFETGHFKMRNEKFDEDNPFDIDDLIENYSEIESHLKEFDFITGYTGRLNFLSEIDNGVDSAPVVTIGIDPEMDRNVFSIEEYLEKGKLEKGGALIGKSLAKDLGVDPGSVVYITFRNKDGMYTCIELLLTGIINSADPRVNNATVFINLNEARKRLGVIGITEIAIKTNNFKLIDKYEKIIKERISGVEILNWRSLSASFAALMETKKKATGYFLFFIVIIALVGIVNTILMSVYEKRREIGTFMALGMERHEVRNLFIIEGLIIGIMGSIIGVILGTLINLYFTTYGIDYSAMIGEENTMGFNVMGVIKSTWEISAYIKSVLLAVTASVAASYYPANKVMKMEPVECLRTVQ